MTSSTGPTTSRCTPIRLEAFYPDIHVEDGVASLRIEFLDGSWADIEWPEELQLLGGGVTLGGWAQMVDGGSSNFFIRQGTVEYVTSALTHWGEITLAREIPDGRGGMVGRWNSSPGGVHFLSFQFGEWAVLAPSLQLWNTAEWATHLRGETTETGFLRLYADEPLSLGDTTATLSGSVELTPGECDPEFGHDVSRWTSTAQWCDESGLMYIYASTSVFDFQLEIYEGLVIKQVYIAPGNG